MINTIINILIIEDESRLADRLERMLKTLNPQLRICAKIPSIEKACQWLLTQSVPDLIFLDIQLEDGECFEIFERVNVDTPVIFCTAYSEYALKAFKFNSIDYLLKPMSEQALEQALNKYQQVQAYRHPAVWSDLLLRADVYSTPKIAYRQRFLVRTRQQLIPIQVLDVQIIQAFMKGTKLITLQQQEFLLDDSLSEIAGTLAPQDFIRISRQNIVRLNAIQAFDLTELTVTLTQPNLCLRVSRTRSNELKAALSR